MQAVGLDGWPRFLADVAERAANAPAGLFTPPAASGVKKAQWFAPLLTPKPPFFLTDPPKGLIPRLMPRIPNQSGKEAAKDVPSWARGVARHVGETPNEYARRCMDEKYGPGKWAKKQ